MLLRYCTVVSDSKTSPFSFKRPRRLDNNFDIFKMLTIFAKVSFVKEKFQQIAYQLVQS